MFAMFFNVVFAVFVCYPAAFCQLCFYNKDWIGLIGGVCCSASVWTWSSVYSRAQLDVQPTFDYIDNWVHFVIYSGIYSRLSCTH